MKKAMTIGELLVTMAIIGIIATLVLPGFLKDYHKKLYVTRLKKVYEMIDTAVNQACADNNVSYFSQTPYSKNGKTNSQAFIDKYFKRASGTNVNPFMSKYKILASGELGSARLIEASHGFAKLAGGEAVSMFCSDAVTYCVFRVDINSKEGPNIGGRDYFSLYIEKATNRIYDGNPSTTCGTDAYGNGCFAKILEDNWEMKY